VGRLSRDALALYKLDINKAQWNHFQRRLVKQIMRRLLPCLLFVLAITFAFAQGERRGALYVGVKNSIVTFATAGRGTLGKRTSFQMPSAYRPGAIVANPKSPVLYVVGYRDDGGNNWALFTLILKSDGTIDHVMQGPIPCDSGSLTMHPNGKYLYNVFSRGFAVRYKIMKGTAIDAASAYPKIRNEWTGETGVAWSPDGRFLYLSVNDSMMDAQLGSTTIDRYRASDGVLKVIPNTTTDFMRYGATSLLVSPDGRAALLLCLNEKMVRYRRNPKTGLLKALGENPYAPDIQVADAIMSPSGEVYALLSDGGVYDYGTVARPLSTPRVLYKKNFIRSIFMGPGCVYAMQYDNSNEKATKSSIIRVPLDGGAPEEQSVEDWCAGACFRSWKGGESVDR
jgi:hypothetical protein